MGFFSRKKTYGREEEELIETIEKRLTELIKEWNGSYEGREFLFEGQFESFLKGIMRYAGHGGHWHLVENEPHPGWGIVFKEKKIYKKLWQRMVKLYRQIPTLIRKGDYQRSLKLLLSEVDLFEKEVIILQKEEMKRWNDILRSLHEYLNGELTDRLKPFEKEVVNMSEREALERWRLRLDIINANLKRERIGELRLPANEYDRKRLVYLLRWDGPLRNAGIREARQLMQNGEIVKRERLKITNRILLMCKAIREDILSLS